MPTPKTAPAKQDAKAPKDDVPNDWLTGYAPGQPPDAFKPGQAKLIPGLLAPPLPDQFVPRGKWNHLLHLRAQQQHRTHE